MSRCKAKGRVRKGMTAKLTRGDCRRGCGCSTGRRGGRVCRACEAIQKQVAAWPMHALNILHTA